MAFYSFSLLICLLVAAKVNMQALPPLPSIAPIPPIAPFPRNGIPRPTPGGPFVPIIQQNFDINPDGTYTFGYQSGDGSYRQEVGTLRPSSLPGNEPVVVVQGAYGYTAPDGQQIEVQYVADENGFQPSGPGVHPAIQRAVAFQVAEARAQLGLPPNGNGPVPRPFPPSPPPPPTPFSSPFPTAFPTSFPTPLPFRPTRR